MVAGSISSLLAGYLADRIGYKPVFLVSYILASPGLFLFLHADGHWIYAASFLAGFFTLATLPIATAIAQTLVTRGQSLVASTTMGLAFGFGGLFSPITGKMADLFSVRAVLGVVIWIPLAASILILYLPRPNNNHQTG